MTEPLSGFQLEISTLDQAVKIVFRLPSPLHSLTCLLTFNPSGELTLEEFIEGAKDHEDIMDTLKKMMDLTPVLVIIVEGRGQWEQFIINYI